MNVLQQKLVHYVMVCFTFRKDYCSCSNKVAAYSRIMQAAHIQYRPQIKHILK